MTATTWLTSEWSRRALSRDVAQRTTACFRLPPVATLAAANQSMRLPASQPTQVAAWWRSVECEMVTAMAVAHLAATPVKAIRLWPGVTLAVLLVLVRFVLPVVFPTMFLQAVLGSLPFTLLIVLWWLFFSRAPWSARVGAIVLMVVALWTTSLLAHPSVAAGMGFVMPAYIAPRFAAIDGKTWNHPVLVRDVLLVRNGEEMAAFRLAMLGRQ